MKRRVWEGAGFLAVIVALGTGQAALEQVAATQTPKGVVPRFEVDPGWPKPLPLNWVLGQTPNAFVDSQDHIWIVNRPGSLEQGDIGASLTPPTSVCCIAAPPVIEFDTAGNVLQSWGGPGAGYEWPEGEHGIFVDYKGNVWIAGNGKTDRQVLKFTNNGKFLLQIGRKGQGDVRQSPNSNDTENMNQPANMFVDPKTNEVFVADGYGNRRVIVFDAATGKYKRHWGAYGNKPDDEASQERTFEGPGPSQFYYAHSIRMSNDNLVYVADRRHNRIQVFTPEGKFLKEAFIARQTLHEFGTVFDFAFSPDKQQQFLYVPDAANWKLRILDRNSLQVLSSFGRQGHFAGQWKWFHGIAGADSKGNIYTTESVGNRVQKFVYKGMGPVTSQ